MYIVCACECMYVYVCVYAHTHTIIEEKGNCQIKNYLWVGIYVNSVPTLIPNTHLIVFGDMVS